MWFDEAQNYVMYAMLIAGVLLIFVWHRASSTPRTLCLLALAFGAGLYAGIGITAKGHLYLPLGVMQKQLQEQWNIPASGLTPPD
jgi:hypothetical protein